MGARTFEVEAGTIVAASEIAATMLQAARLDGPDVPVDPAVGRAVLEGTCGRDLAALGVVAIRWHPTSRLVRLTVDRTERGTHVLRRARRLFG